MINAKNLHGNYQVWKLNESLATGFVDSFDTQEEAQEFIEQNFNLWKNPKWEICTDSRPMIKTKIKNNCSYSFVCITLKSLDLLKTGDDIELDGIFTFGELDKGGSQFCMNLNGKTGTVVDCWISKNDHHDDQRICYKIECKIFGETVYFNKTQDFTHFSRKLNDSRTIKPITQKEKV